MHVWLHSATLNRLAILISLLKLTPLVEQGSAATGAAIVVGSRVGHQRHPGMMQARTTPGAGREVLVNAGGERTPDVESRGGEAAPVRQMESRRQ